MERRRRTARHATTRHGGHQLSPHATPGAHRARVDTQVSRFDARFALLCIGAWLHSADTLITATIAPAIVDDLSGIAYINWTISLYEVGAIIAGAAAGMLCARFSIRNVFLGATLMYGGGCLAGALAPTIGVLISARLFQGLGGGMLLSLCYVAVEAWYEPERWNRLFGVVAMIWGAGSLVGPLIGGLFANRHAWRGSFWIFALQALITCVLAKRLLPSASGREPMPSQSSAARWPLLPLVILSAATLIIAEAGALDGTGWTGALAVGGCVLGLALLYLAARADRSAAVRLLPAKLMDLGHPVGCGLMMVLALSAATTGFWAYGPLLLKILFGTRPLVTGYILAGEAFAWSLATLAVSSATPAADRLLIRGGTVCVAAGAGGFALAVPSGSLTGMVICGLAQGTGFGLCWPAIVQRIVRASEPDEKSLASASASTVQRIGYAVGSAAVGIAANWSGLADGISVAAAKSAGFWVFAAFLPLLAIGLGCAWRFTREWTPRTRAA